MSHFLDRLTHFSLPKESFSGDLGRTTGEDRTWEDSYRKRWQHDKIVRSTHGTNCTGSCSWKIYVKGGIVTWETQQTDYPRTRPDLPNHEPRGCARGASYSWYLYSANRVKYPMVRARLLKHWRAALAVAKSPVDAWASIVENPQARQEWVAQRGLGGFVRSSWEEVNQLIASANVYTAKKHGPDRVVGFSPIPAMSMISYAAGSRYLSLIGGVSLSFYDWYCDLPPSSPQVWGEQTDVPESADWYNSNFIIAWGSNVPQTRTPDAHFFTEVRYKGAKTVAITPDYAEVSKLADLWLHPKQGTDAAIAMAMGHVILKEFYIDKRSEYFDDYARRYTDMPLLVQLERRTLPDGREVLVPDRYVRASDFGDKLGQDNNPDWKTVAFDSAGEVTLPNGAIGFRWGPDGRPDAGKWNLEAKDARQGSETRLKLSVLEDGAQAHSVEDVAFPYFGGIESPQFTPNQQGGDVSVHRVPVARLTVGAAGETREALVATVFDLMLANYGVKRGLPGETAAGYDDNAPYTPAWQEQITGVPRQQVIAVARQFADNADKTQGKSMIIIGAGMNHWYHCDMNYRGIIHMLMMCGCIGQSGGGWAHYVGQEKLRPQTGWTALAFALDWIRPPRQMNGTSFFYAHTDQWRYETLKVDEVLSPLADKRKFGGSLIDYNVRAERMGWLPSAPQLKTNPLTLDAEAKARGLDTKDYVVQGAEGRLAADELRRPGPPGQLAAQPVRLALQPARLQRQGPRVLPQASAGHDAWRAGQGPGRRRRQAAGSDLARQGARRQARPAGHAGLPHEHDLPVFGHRAADRHLVREERPQHQRHAPLHPPAVDRGRPGLAGTQRLGDLQGFRQGLQRGLRRPPGCREGGRADAADARHPGGTGAGPGRQGVEEGRVRTDSRQDRAGRSAVVERDYPNTYARFTALGPLMEKVGNGGKGITWNTAEEVRQLAELNGKVHTEGRHQGHAEDRHRHRRRRGHPAARARDQRRTSQSRPGRRCPRSPAANTRTWRCTARTRRSASATSRRSRARSSAQPTWSGLESEKVSYNAGYTNVHELIPWRTLTGRQQFYQDHKWMIAFGEGLSQLPPAGRPEGHGADEGHKRPMATGRSR